MALAKQWLIGGLLALGAGGLMLAGVDHISLGFQAFGSGLIAASCVVAIAAVAAIG